MRASRVCPQPDCPEFQPCAKHARPGPRQRGYDRAHDKRRAEWAPQVAAGQVRCWRPTCGQLIRPDELWHLGHDDADRTITRGPEHVLCNLSAAGHASHDTPR